ncbi:glycosyl transferase family 39 [Roseomonas sp. USHLN139]|uniref:glycosyl transferase family 39 n=1 Tax=Roseomonas sp. USHLN139 TaxID=3081298 RepID=UPI003B021CC6
MIRIAALPALAIAAGLALAPSLSQARDLLENTNNASATGSPFAYAMPVTRAAEQGAPLVVGNSAAPQGSPLGVVVATTQAHSAGLPQAVGNSASASGGFGTGRIRG